MSRARLAGQLRQPEPVLGGHRGPRASRPASRPSGGPRPAGSGGVPKRRPGPPSPRPTRGCADRARWASGRRRRPPAGQIAQPDQRLDDPRVVLVGQPGQQVVAEPARVREGSALVASSRWGWPIASRWSRSSARDTFSRGRIRRGGSASRRRAGMPPGPGAGPAEDAVQDRLGLVVARVADGHRRRPAARATSASQA